MSAARAARDALYADAIESGTLTQSALLLLKPRIAELQLCMGCRERAEARHLFCALCARRLREQHGMAALDELTRATLALCSDAQYMQSREGVAFVGALSAVAGVDVVGAFHDALAATPPPPRRGVLPAKRALDGGDEESENISSLRRVYDRVKRARRVDAQEPDSAASPPPSPPRAHTPPRRARTPPLPPPRKRVLMQHVPLSAKDMNSIMRSLYGDAYCAKRGNALLPTDASAPTNGSGIPRGINTMMALHFKSFERQLSEQALETSDDGEPEPAPKKKAAAAAAAAAAKRQPTAAARKKSARAKKAAPRKRQKKQQCDESPPPAPALYPVEDSLLTFSQ